MAHTLHACQCIDAVMRVYAAHARSLCAAHAHVAHACCDEDVAGAFTLSFSIDLRPSHENSN